MEISIKWQHRYKQEQCADPETSRLLLTKPVWNTFDMASILDRSRDHALSLLRRDIPVVIKESGAIISNDLEMRNLYRRKGNKIYDLTAIQPSTGILRDVGFTSDA